MTKSEKNYITRNSLRTILCQNPLENTWIRVKVPFDLKRIRGFTEEEGLSTRAWDDRDLQSVVDTLVRNRLVDDLGEGRYRISDTGLECKEPT